MSRNSDLEKVIKNAEVQGFRYSRTSTGHHQLYAPNRKDIVTTSGTPSDSRGWNNFLSDLKRAGYMELQTLGDAMPEKEAMIEELPKAKLTVRQYIVDVLSRHPEGMSSANVGAYIRSVLPDMHMNIHHNALSLLTKQRILRRMPSGVYVLGDVKMDMNPLGTKKKKPVVPAGPRPEQEVFRTKTGDTSIDKDMKAMDVALNDALVALTKVDTIAQRMKTKLSKFAQLRELLK